MTGLTPSPPLSPEEAQALARHEATIERGIKTFIEVGEALLAIRDARLYRATHRTFEDYCRERWDIGRSHGYRLIEAAKQADLVREVSPNGDIPKSEAQLRELAPIKNLNVRAEVVERVEAAGGWGKVTARDIRQLRVEEEHAFAERQRRAVALGARTETAARLHELGSTLSTLTDDEIAEVQASVDHFCALLFAEQFRRVAPVPTDAVDAEARRASHLVRSALASVAEVLPPMVVQAALDEWAKPDERDRLEQRRALMEREARGYVERWVKDLRDNPLALDELGGR